jgi:hypothetical protein
MSFCIRFLFHHWLQIHLCCPHHLCCPLLILPSNNTTPILSVTEVVPAATGAQQQHVQHQWQVWFSWLSFFCSHGLEARSLAVAQIACCWWAVVFSPVLWAEHQVSTMLLLQPHSPTLCSVLQQWSPVLYPYCCWSGFCPYLVPGHRCEPTRYAWSCDSDRLCTLSW